MELDRNIYFRKGGEKFIIEESVDNTPDIDFFIEYCGLVFDENYEEAQWNYCKYFTIRMKDEIEMYDNPMGLEWWDELD